MAVLSVMFLSLFGRRTRGEAKKCRKVYGIEHRDQWCTACRWKKACQRFLDWTEEEEEEEEERRGLRKAVNFGLTWWMFYTFWNQKYFVFILFLHFARSIFFYLDVFCRCCFCRTHRGSYDVTLDLEECLRPADSPQVSAASGSVRAPRF